MQIEKNLKIDRTFFYKGYKYIVAESNDCKGCHFNINGHGCLSITGIESLPLCSPIVRADRKSVVFKRF